MTPDPNLIDDTVLTQDLYGKKRHRAAAHRAETAIHAAADAMVPKFEVALRYAFARARKLEATDADAISTVLHAALLEVLPSVIRETVFAGGDAALEMLSTQIRTAGGPGSGDLPGHEFHGNQWTGGQGQTETLAFKAWFKDSKVVDKNGQPLRVYHGTPVDFEAFDLEKTWLSPLGVTGGLGAFFTTIPEEAAHYADKGVTIPAYLSIQHPKIITQDSPEWDKALNSKHDAVEVRRTLIAQGYDGAVIPHLGEYVAFHPEQIKSAIGNRGTFDPKNPLITMELRSAKILKRLRTTNPEAIDFIKKHGTALADDLTQTSRKAIKAALVESFEGKLNVRETEQAIAEAIGDKDRAKRIARAETMLAANVGQRMAWGQAIDDGDLPGNSRRVWIATGDDRVCDECDELDGEVIDFEGEYSNGTDGPPAHPLCRCTEGIV